MKLIAAGVFLILALLDLFHCAPLIDSDNGYIKETGTSSSWKYNAGYDGAIGLQGGLKDGLGSLGVYKRGNVTIGGSKTNDQKDSNIPVAQLNIPQSGQPNIPQVGQQYNPQVGQQYFPQSGPQYFPQGVSPQYFPQVGQQYNPQGVPQYFPQGGPQYFPQGGPQYFPQGGGPQYFQQYFPQPQYFPQGGQPYVPLGSLQNIYGMIN